MNRANVWTLCDAGDSSQLEAAIAKAPACMNVRGWSYHNGKRRGVCFAPDGTISVGSQPEANPSPILFFAAIGGHLRCVMIALQCGASSESLLNGKTADEVALAVGHEDVAEAILKHRERLHNPALLLEEQEEQAREAISEKEEQGRRLLEECCEAGLVKLTVEVRSGLDVTTWELELSRFSSHRQVQEAIERKCDGQRLLISFSIPKKMIVAMNKNPSIRAFGCPPLKSEDSDDETTDPQQVATSRVLGLKPRTVAYLLHMENPKCIARPFLPSLKEEPSPIREHLHQVTTMPSAQRVAALKKLVGEADTAVYGKPKTLDSSQKDELLRRVYDNAMHSRKKRRQSIDDFLETQASFLARRGRVGELSDTEAITVDRLYTAAREARIASSEQADEMAEERRPKPKVVQRTREEVSETCSRLFAFAEVKAKKVQEKEAEVYGDSEPAVLEKDQFDRLISSVYDGAREKKKNALEKVRKNYGDFRSKKKAKTLSPEELKALGDRLSKK